MTARRARPLLAIAIAIAGLVVALFSLPTAALAQDPPPGPPPCMASPEVCDGIDNDCDGVIDDGNPGGALACATGFLGACGTGTTQCVSGSVICTPEFLPGAHLEICDGIDNDCDGAIDEPFGVGTWCSVGVGACQSWGWIVCNAAGGALCNAVPFAPTPETCDGIDNDCDGIVDDGDLGGGAPCDTGMAGVCALGLTKCAPGGVVDCVAIVQPASQPETCDDDLDADCDGAPSNGCSAQGTGGSAPTTSSTSGGAGSTLTSTGSGGAGSTLTSTGSGGSDPALTSTGSGGSTGEGSSSSSGSDGGSAGFAGSGSEGSSSSSSGGDGGDGGSAGSAATGAASPAPHPGYGAPFGCSCTFYDETDGQLEDVACATALAFAAIFALSTRRTSSRRFTRNIAPRRHR